MVLNCSTRTIIFFMGRTAQVHQGDGTIITCGMLTPQKLFHIVIPLSLSLLYSAFIIQLVPIRTSSNTRPNWPSSTSHSTAHYSSSSHSKPIASSTTLPASLTTTPYDSTPPSSSSISWSRNEERNWRTSCGLTNRRSCLSIFGLTQIVPRFA